MSQALVVVRAGLALLLAGAFFTASSQLEPPKLEISKVKDGLYVIEGDGGNTGVLVTGEGLRASRQGARVKFRGGKPNVIDGPFAESKELISGFSIIEVPSRDEAIAWVKKWPQLDGHGEVEIEIRQIFEAADFGEAFTPELQQREQAMRSAQAAKAKA